MRVTVEFTGKKKGVEVPGGSKVIDVIRKVKINPETVIVRRGDEILLEEDRVRENDRLEFIRVVSGG